MRCTFALIVHPTVRRAVLWLLVCVVPLQGALVGALTATGPAHIHARGAAVPVLIPVLIDVRRWPSLAAGEEAGIERFVGHSHGAGSAQRHHHPRADASVVLTGEDASMGATDADGGPSALGAASMLGWIPGGLVWQAVHVTVSRPWRPLWAISTGFSTPLDRPPKAG